MSEPTTTQECPKCNDVISEMAEKCPACDTKLVMCDRCGSLVTEEEFKAAVSMCENCWHVTVNQ
ncbi:MAG: hypothetical protein CME33_09370 [Gimesia sp.]|nr:hypothetical protein [Gimesia sp.]